MSSIYELMTNCCVSLENIERLFRKRPVLTSKFDVSKLQKQLQRVIQIHWTSLPTNFARTMFSKYHIMHARYFFQLEDLFQCLQYTNL